MQQNQFSAFVSVTILSIGTLWSQAAFASRVAYPLHMQTLAMVENVEPLMVGGKGKPSGFGKKPSTSFQKPATPQRKSGITGPNKPRIPKPWPPVPTPAKPIKPTKPQKGDPPPDRPLKPKGPKWKPPGI